MILRAITEISAVVLISCVAISIIPVPRHKRVKDEVPATPVPVAPPVVIEEPAPVAAPEDPPPTEKQITVQQLLLKLDRVEKKLSKVIKG